MGSTQFINLEPETILLRLLVWGYWSIFTFHFVSPGDSVRIQDHWKKTSNWTFGCVSWCLNKPINKAEMLVIFKGKQTHFNEVMMMEEILHCKAISVCAGLMTTVLSWLFCTVHEFLVSNNDSKLTFSKHKRNMFYTTIALHKPKNMIPLFSAWW